MEYETLEEWIRTENGNQPSADDQVWMAHWARDKELFVSDDELLRTRQITEMLEEELEHNPKTPLNNLEEIGVFEKVEPTGARSFIQSERTGDLFYTPENEDFPPLLAEEVSRFFDDLDAEEKVAAPIADGGEEEHVDRDDKTLRSVAAEALEVEPEEVEEEITGDPDPVERLDRYETAVEAIVESEDVEREGNYDVMGWRNSANRWGLSLRAEKIADSAT